MSLATQKTKMTFNNDEFVKNDRRVYGTADKNMPKGSLLQLDEQLAYPAPRPIGEIMAQAPKEAAPIGELMIQMGMTHYTPAEYDNKVLAGA